MTQQHLSLAEHMTMLGLDPYRLSLKTGLTVPQVAIKRALEGSPISHEHAMRICQVLNEEHGIESGKSHNPVTGFLPEHIRGLNIYYPPEIHSRPAPKV